MRVSWGPSDWTLGSRRGGARGGPMRGRLAGTYAGVSGSVGVGVGVGANVLFGGSHRSIALQPLSIEGSVGVNLSLGVCSLPVPPASGKRTTMRTKVFGVFVGALLLPGVLCSGGASGEGDVTKSLQDKLVSRVQNLQESCARDIKKYCKAVTPGEGRIIYC